MKKNLFVTLMLFIFVLSGLFGCQSNRRSPVDYSDASMWAFSESDQAKQADVFFVAPTVYYGDEKSFNMPIDDEKNRERMIGALNMEIGIYNEMLNVYSPFYRQASLSSVDNGKYQVALDTAYADIAAAFDYYMKHRNNNRPFVFSGFSQGAELCIRLMKDYPEYLKNMVACYIYGYAVTDETIKAYPQIVPAAGACDTGVVVCFNSEAPAVNDTFTVPAGVKSICINPLNWKTDGTVADKALHKGACFLDYDGTITTETLHFTGAYIDEARGTLKLPDVDPEDYKSKLTFLKDGEYHLNEYEFFYRNLQENVKVRLTHWLEK